MSDVLSREAIVLGGQARTREDAISEAGALLVASGAVPQGYVDAMHERERSVSTFMGNGLAIPHGTNEAKALIERTAISFVRYDEPIDWDGSGKFAFFVVGIAGAGNDHLTVLQAIAGTFADPQGVDALATAQSPDDVLAVLGARL